MEIFLGILFIFAGIFNIVTAIITDYNEKWNEHQIKVSSILEAIKPYQPLFGHPTRRNDTTIWMTFMKF